MYGVRSQPFSPPSPDHPIMPTEARRLASLPPTAPGVHGAASICTVGVWSERVASPCLPPPILVTLTDGFAFLTQPTSGLGRLVPRAPGDRV